MNKKFLYIGIMLLVLGVVVSFFSLGVELPSQFSRPVPQSVSVGPGSTDYQALYLNQSGILEVVFNSSAPLDFYLANASAFASINASGSPSAARNAAIRLEGNGVFAFYADAKNGTFPYLGYQGIARPAYASNATVVLPAGQYYSIFANNGTTAASVTIAESPITLSKLQAGSSSVIKYVGASGVMFLVGLGLIVFSFFAKGEKKAGEGGMDEEAAREYERIERSGKKHHAKS